ncbi:hypothetical protein C2G38_2205607 [Gigaspora rosea]|uniref:Serine-threonine/tyrosine-protein kinase catalytic domain-containing protein n=1 Tax=Gigaspora rosea TaxID=44941 RepID=A0A397UPH5_9GLOM|nr:hypothetical protein C2G38_2205607 [Gigaspora rosea]
MTKAHSNLGFFRPFESVHLPICPFPQFTLPDLRKARIFAVAVLGLVCEDLGGFATVYDAIWIDNSSIPVSLKLLHESNNYYEDFIKERIVISDLEDSTFLNCFGISKGKTSGNYILVMKYALRGSLRPLYRK